MFCYNAGPQKSVATPTICDSKHRTINIDAPCGGPDDWYYFSPWRAPGAAPVMDSCGVAGGHKPPQGGFGGIYVNTTHAKLGDHGTKVLPAHPTGVTWKAGVEYEVSWTIEANHAGGYLYRLAPADGPLTEETFQQIPLEFVGQQGFRWGGGPKNGGSELFFNGTYVSEGTVPAGSKWSLNPIPRTDHGGSQPKKCVETPTERCSEMQVRCWFHHGFCCVRVSSIGLRLQVRCWFHHGFCCVRVSSIGLRLQVRCWFHGRLFALEDAIELHAFALLEALPCE